MQYLRKLSAVGIALIALLVLVAGPAAAQQRPNIIMIMGNDVGCFNIGAYHREFHEVWPEVSVSATDGVLRRINARRLRMTDAAYGATNPSTTMKEKRQWQTNQTY